MLYLQPIHDEPGYHRRVALMNSLLDVAGNDEDHARSGLLERVGDWVSRYEREHDPIEPASPKDSLLFLLQARGLVQDDLSGINPARNPQCHVGRQAQHQRANGGKAR
jgi:HTH-type transcriptional regulator/antitoxin HigA